MSVGRVCGTHGRIDCAECARPRKDTRPSAYSRGYNARWKGTRADYLRYFPICQDHAGCIRDATQVHHLDGQGPRGTRGHDWGNLQGLCGYHHAAITAKEKPSGWNAPNYARDF